MNTKTIIHSPLLGAHIKGLDTDIIEQLRDLETEQLESVLDFWLRHSDYARYGEGYRTHIRLEFLRFMSLKFFTDKPLFPPPAIDDFLHTFILHTEEYMAFCVQHFGAYVHHKPHPSTPSEEYRQSEEGKTTIELARSLYPDISDDIWELSFKCAI
ncbi:MAG: hypothetical protein Q7R93_02855 [bacterium]|nr:hypothetical protein [bacterium]